jgi:hypothetical protein
MVAAMAGALIYSKGLIVFEKPLYIPVLIAAVLLVLAVRFPRAAGFPLILISGCAVIWIGYAFLQFPLIAAGGSFRVSIANEGNGQYAARFASGRRTIPEQDLLIHLEGEGRPEDRFLEFTFVRVSYAPSFPLIGGENRGIVSEVRGENAVFYTDPRFTGSLLRGWYAAGQKKNSDESGSRHFEEFRERVAVTDILPGIALDLAFGGN